MKVPSKKTANLISKLICVLFAISIVGCGSPPPPPTPDDFDQYIFLYGFDLQGGMFRGDDVVSCSSPKAEEFCATDCNNILHLTNAARKLEAAMVESTICSQEAKGMAIKVADKVIDIYIAVWGISDGLVYRKDVEYSCSDETAPLVDLCALSCNSLSYLTSKVRHLKAAIQSDEILGNLCSFFRSAKAVRFHRDLIEVRQMIKSMDIELKEMP